MLSQLEVRDFRCFTSTKLALHPQTHLIVGRNAQGKTSLLEAACVLLRLQSPRTNVRTEMIRFGQKAFVVEGQCGDQTLRCGMSEKGKRLAMGQVICKTTSEYLAHGELVVWMDHNDMNLIRGGSDHRRRFMDFSLLQVEPDYHATITAFNRILRSRNYLLKRDASINWRQVDAYGKLMNEHHEKLTKWRRRFIADLTPLAQASLRDLSLGSETVDLTFAPGCVEGQLYDHLLAHRSEEESQRSTYTGSHRDDLTVMINGKPAQAFASEGQQRSLSIAIKLAQAQCMETTLGRSPLFLIDDIFGELDHHRRQALLDGLPQGSQKIITTTDLGWFMKPEKGAYSITRIDLSQIVSEPGDDV
jgi:DNA replication and repair protein RecF